MKRPIPPRLVVADEPVSFSAEAYRVLRTNLRYANPDAPLRRVLVTSAGPGEGKSTTLANLGVALAQSEQSVLLVDSDLRKPVLHTIFHQRASLGLSSYLAGDALFEAVVIKTAIPNLALVPSGSTPPNPAELLASRRMREFLATAAEQYDLVLLDSAPVLAVADTCALVSLVDGVLLVIASGAVPEAAVRRAKQQVEAAQGRIVGAVLNRFNAKSNGYYPGYYEGYYRKGPPSR